MGNECLGCGIPIQSTNKEKDGYAPKVLTNEKAPLYCKRCFQLQHYGIHAKTELAKDDYANELSSIIDEKRLALAVFDIIDFEGSFQDDILDILREMHNIVVVNKLDLIPDEKHPSEVASWVKRRLEEEGIFSLDIAIVSSKNGYGINGILKKIKHFYPDGVEALILGATNVGKSSIVNRLLGKRVMTVSKYPGTTLKKVTNKIPMTNITLIDTPGLIPEGRFSDLVCESCNLNIIASEEISRKTYKPEKDKVLLIGNMIKFRILNDGEIKPIFSIYASKNVTFHKTSIEKSKKLEGKDFLFPACTECFSEYHSNKMKTEKISINVGQELVFTGLGWLTVKRGPLDIEIVYPENSRIMLRKSFIESKR